MKRTLLIIAVLLFLAVAPRGAAIHGVRVGSKQFTESIILGDIITQAIQAGGHPSVHLAELGGTQIVFDALRRGEIDLYPEYTGTLVQEIFADHPEASNETLPKLLAEVGIGISEPLGFNNTYALAVRRDTAVERNLRTISDLAAHPDLRMGFSNEFIDRKDGWKPLRRRYGLTHTDVSGRVHDLAYRQLEAGSLDVIDVYMTDAQIKDLDLVVLEDDLEYFPRYDAVILYRKDLETRFPEVVDAFTKLEGAIPTEQIMALNSAVKSRAATKPQAAATFLRERFLIEMHVEDPSVASEVWQRTLEHLDLVRRSLIPAIFTAVPLGIIAAKLPGVGQVILGLVGIVQTIPALALLVLLIPPVAYLELDTLGSESATAIAALFLYSLLPIVRNTATGIGSIAPEHQESAAALGLSPLYRLLHIELPLAAPAILAGVKTAAVLNVGFATLGALVGARGYGQPILTGIRLNDAGLIMQGAIPAAGMAIALQLLFELSERWFVPAGLRPK